MGCGCNKGRALAASAPANGWAYRVTFPLAAGADTPETKTYGTPLEAKREVRKAGGGTIVRVPAEAA